MFFFKYIIRFYSKGKELCIYEGNEDKYVIETTSAPLLLFALT